MVPGGRAHGEAALKATAVAALSDNCKTVLYLPIAQWIPMGSSW
jgi:hypothetical protein